MAPWLCSQFTALSTYNTVDARYLPGAVWKNFVAPSIGNKNVGSVNSSGANQLLSLKVFEPVFEMDTYSSDNDSEKGRQMQNTFLPTYSRQGLDDTSWNTMWMTYVLQSGAADDIPNTVYHMLMRKVTYAFKGLRMQKTSALEYVPFDEKEAERQCYTNVPNIDINWRIPNSSNQSDNMVPNSKRPRTSKPTDTVF